MKWVLAIRLLVVGALAGGCTRILAASVAAPNPLSNPSARNEASYDVTILIKDVKQPEGLARTGDQAGVNSPLHPHANGLPEYIGPRYFRQSAWLRFAKPDEVRFEVLLTDEWRELVSLRGYNVELRDDQGVLIRPGDAWQGAESHRDYEATYQAWKNFQTVRTHDSGTFQMWAPEEYYVQERVYRAHGTVIFRRPDLLKPNTRSLTLTLTSRIRTLHFTWIFTSLAEEARR